MQSFKRANNSIHDQRSCLKALCWVLVCSLVTSCATFEQGPISRADYNAAAANFNQAVQNFSNANQGRYIQGAPARPITIQQNQAQPNYFIQTPPNGW